MYPTQQEAECPNNVQWLACHVPSLLCGFIIAGFMFVVWLHNAKMTLDPHENSYYGALQAYWRLNFSHAQEATQLQWVGRLMGLNINALSGQEPFVWASAVTTLAMQVRYRGNHM